MFRAVAAASTEAVVSMGAARVSGRRRRERKVGVLRSILFVLC